MPAGIWPAVTCAVDAAFLRVAFEALAIAGAKLAHARSIERIFARWQQAQLLELAGRTLRLRIEDADRVDLGIEQDRCALGSSLPIG